MCLSLSSRGLLTLTLLSICTLELSFSCKKLWTGIVVSILSDFSDFFVAENIDRCKEIKTPSISLPLLIKKLDQRGVMAGQIALGCTKGSALCLSIFDPQSPICLTIVSAHSWPWHGMALEQTQVCNLDTKCNQCDHSS